MWEKKSLKVVHMMKSYFILRLIFYKYFQNCEHNDSISLVAGEIHNDRLQLSTIKAVKTEADL